MTFWIISVAIAATSALWIAWPFLRGRTVEISDSDSTMSIYRDQIDEVERDLEAGLISSDECEAARVEIQRRALKAARKLDRGLSVSQRSLTIAAPLALVVAALSLATYGWLGEAGYGDLPLAERKEQRLNRMAEAGDLSSRIQVLIKAVGENPDSFEDWWMLARSYSAIGDHASAADAYRNAANLSGDRPAVLSAYGEAMTLANGNRVPSAARLIFEQLLQETNDPRARYYLALAKAQAQDFEGAVNDWATLARESSPDAPWMPLVRRDIANMARFLDRDVTEFLPDATPEMIALAGSSLLPGSETATTDLTQLEMALRNDPMDYESWIALAEARAAAGDNEGAAQALADARSQFSAAPFLMQKFAETERKLGLDLAKPAPRGPTEEDIAAAAEMTQVERDDMIAGMVAGLAARLEEDPGDPDGWIMLIRSYATLGQRENAGEALKSARAHFRNDPATLRTIESQVGELRVE